MYSIIKDMFLNRCGRENMPVSEKHYKIAEELCGLEEKITKLLPKNKKRLMRDYTMKQCDMFCDIEDTAFAEGFKLGLMIGAETFFTAEK